jgi:hypothetical protein
MIYLKHQACGIGCSENQGMQVSSINAGFLVLILEQAAVRHRRRR